MPDDFSFAMAAGFLVQDDGIGGLALGVFGLLAVALFVALGFEFVNGFHDTANAVATVIYTKSLKPTPAVIWSGLWNFIGVHAGGIGVAFSIVHLLPVDLLVNIKTGRGLAMVLSLLGVIVCLQVLVSGCPLR